MAFVFYMSQEILNNKNIDLDCRKKKKYVVRKRNVTLNVVEMHLI